jgi:hypothetical protein
MVNQMVSHNHNHMVNHKVNIWFCRIDLRNHMLLSNILLWLTIWLKIYLQNHMVNHNHVV